MLVASNPLIQVKPGLMIWTIVCFALAFFVLRRYAFGPIQAVARQPELRGELQGIQWLGFALTEAVVFYGLLGSILAFVLV